MKPDAARTGLALILLLPITLMSSPVLADHTSDCRQLQAAIEHAPRDLLDNTEFGFLPCPEISLLLIDRELAAIEADPAAWMEENEEDPASMEETRNELAVTRFGPLLKAELQRRDQPAALATLDTIDRADKARESPWDDEGSSLATIKAVLQGKVRPITGPAPAAPNLPWELNRYPRTCGTGLYMAMMYQMSAPLEADAWVAVNRTDMALARYLDEFWVDAAEDATVPLRLRELAERHYGEQRANIEFETALAGIRIDDGPLGRSASIPLFGRWFPLPVAVIQHPMREYDTDGDAKAGPPPERTEWTENTLAESLRASWQQNYVRDAINAVAEEITYRNNEASDTENE